MSETGRKDKAMDKTVAAKKLVSLGVSPVTAMAMVKLAGEKGSQSALGLTVTRVGDGKFRVSR